MAKNAARSIVAVEFSQAFLKLVEYLPLENQISMVAVKPLDVMQWGNDEYLAERIQTWLKKHVKAGRVDLIGAVSAKHAALRTVEIPGEEDNPLDALQWDMEQYLARPLDDYLMDYQALGSNESETGRLYLVAAYRRGEVERLRRILESTGFPLVVMDVDAFAAVNAFEANYPDMQQGRTFLVKADADALTCVRTQNGMFLGCDTKALDAGILDLNGPDKTDSLLHLVRDIRAYLDGTRDTWGEVDNVVLCGDLALDEEFRELLESNVPMPFFTLNAFKEVTFAIGSDSTLESIIPSAPQFAAALGLALRRGGDG